MLSYISLYACVCACFTHHEMSFFALGIYVILQLPVDRHSYWKEEYASLSMLCGPSLYMPHL